jgi:ABC-type uncharacterized transport system substrate-binding protein
MTHVWTQRGFFRQTFGLAGVLIFAWLLSSCALLSPVEQPAPVKQTVVQKPAKVAILLSHDIPEFVSIADALGERLGEGNYSIHHLRGRPHYAARVLKEVDASKADQLVAIGLLAARVGRKQQLRPMVFCQTYNYLEHNLVSDTSKGVSFLPPFDQQFQSWQMLSPNLHRIGVVTGPNQAKILQQIRLAASSKNIEVVTRTVSSDKEAMLETRRLVSDVQGLLLLPDNRVLSPYVLREIMYLGARRRTEIAVYSRKLLELGALISFSGSPDDIAKNVVVRLNQISKNGQVEGPELRPLSALEIQINPAVAGELSLVIPRQFSRVRGD